MDKHNANLCILQILKKHTDKDHVLSQQEVLRCLKDEYDLTIDRRSVKSNIEFLQQAGYEIETEGGYRLVTRELEDAELRMLIDSVLFSRYISGKQASQLIEKLRGMSSSYFSARLSHVSGLREMQYIDNQQVLYSIETISDAIDANRKIHYTSSHYGTDFKRHPGTEHTVSPYQIVANNGRFYLICHDERYHDTMAVYYRIDRMRDVQITKEMRYPQRKVEGMRNGLNLPKHMAEHVFMFRGESIPIRVRTKADMMDNLIDWFGKEFSIISQEDDEITARIKCNEDSFFYWAMLYGTSIEVVSPASLRSRLADASEKMAEKYRRSVNDSWADEERS